MPLLPTRRESVTRVLLRACSSLVWGHCSGEFPDADGLVVAGRGDLGTTARPSDAIDPPRVAGEEEAAFARLGFPDAGGPVFAGRHQIHAIGRPGGTFDEAGVPAQG